MQLRDKEIIDLLLDYVKDKRYKQAVLIDGKWGTGKTYFVKEKLLNSIKKNLPERSVFYISLYGISKPSQIIEEIYSATVGDFLEKRIGKEKGEKVEKGINIASKLFAAGRKHADNSRRCDHLSAYSHIVHLLSYIPIPRHAPAKKAAPDLFPGLLAPSASVSSYHRQSDYSSYFCMIYLRVSRRRSGRQTAP